MLLTRFEIAPSSNVQKPTTQPCVTPTYLSIHLAEFTMRSK